MTNDTDTDNVMSGLDEVVEDSTLGTGEVPCEFVCGCAGTGKTYVVRERIANDPSYGLLCATTGIAAVNLGDAVTINSALRYFDTDDHRDNHLSGSLTRRLRDLSEEYDRIIIDEISMMDAQQLTLIYVRVRPTAF
jgi:hypothetical protein